METLLLRCIVFFKSSRTISVILSNIFITSYPFPIVRPCPFLLQLMFGYRHTLEAIPIQVKLYTTHLRKTIPLSLKSKNFSHNRQKRQRLRTPKYYQRTAPCGCCPLSIYISQFVHSNFLPAFYQYSYTNCSRPIVTYMKIC